MQALRLLLCVGAFLAAAVMLLARPLPSRWQPDAPECECRPAPPRRDYGRVRPLRYEDGRTAPAGAITHRAKGQAPPPPAW